MATNRQSGAERFAIRGNHDFYNHHEATNGNSSGGDQISIRIPHKHAKIRRSRDKIRRPSIAFVVVILSLILIVTFFAFTYLSGDKEYRRFNGQDDDKNDIDFLSNVTQTKGFKVLQFGQGSVTVGRDSRYWDRDDRRRYGEYDGDTLDVVNADDVNQSTAKNHVLENESGSKQFSSVGNRRKSNEKVGGGQKSVGLYNEAGRDELKHYEAEYEASLKNVGQSREENVDKHGVSGGAGAALQNEDVNSMEEYDDGFDSEDSWMEEFGDTGRNNVDYSDVKKHVIDDDGESLDTLDGGNEDSTSIKKSENDNEGLANTIVERSSLSDQSFEDPQVESKRGNVFDDVAMKKSSVKKDSRRKGRHHKFSGSTCEMKFLNSTAQLVEPSENRKFVRFSLRYTEIEDMPNGSEEWEPRFAGHQTLQEREESFHAHDQKINCGFIKGPKGSSSTGFDLAEDDERFMSTCHVAVSSCIFGNSDKLRTPTNKVVTRLSRKNVCFVMFMDENTLQTLSSEGQKPDNMGFIGLWKIVVVKNLPYKDMRRVGKIPKFLTHRLFPSARYSIWLDSKLRLQTDPLLILEYFLWRRGYEYAISNHYDRHCVWEEVIQNKKLNKYNHTVIDQQFAFYQRDGLKRFNASDSNKLLPSYVPEGSFIVRAHTPMSNLFSCLWFNEVERFTPRDQLSFAYTYMKLRQMNPGKPFHLNMFKDCERRSIVKLFRHRAEEKRNVPTQAAG